MGKDAKKILKEVLEKDCMNNFTMSELLSRLQYECDIQRPWATECLKAFGYVYDRVNRVWYKEENKPYKEENAWVTKETYDKLVEENAQMRKLINSLENFKERHTVQKAPGPEIDKEVRIIWQMRDFEKFPDHKLAFDLERMLYGIANKEYCEGCNKLGKCSINNKFFNKPCKALLDLTEDIKFSLNGYLNKVGRDWAIHYNK